MKVDLIDYMGTDLTVVNSARVSFDKESEWEVEGWTDDKLEDNSRVLISEPILKLSEKDKKLIHYLAKHKHISPFGHCFASFRVKAPIFVARQLVKHKFLRWNEVSRRYVDSEPEFFIPDELRKRADNAKQGSGGSIQFPNKSPQIEIEETAKVCSDLYNKLLEVGVCPEQARMVLPQSMYTEWYWSGSLDAFADMCRLRLDPHAQKESREIAEQVDKHMRELFPVSWSALMEN